MDKEIYHFRRFTINFILLFSADLVTTARKFEAGPGVSGGMHSSGFAETNERLSNLSQTQLLST